MDNAAQLLYDRLKEWQTSPVGVPLINSRAIDGMSWIDTHLETLRWFVQVRDRMTDDVYTDVVNNMAIAILGGDIGVTGRPDGRAIISDSDLLVLKMLADNWGDVGQIRLDSLECVLVNTHDVGAHAASSVIR